MNTAVTRTPSAIPLLQHATDPAKLPYWDALHLSRKEALRRLADKPQGTFVIRQSQKYHAALSVVHTQGLDQLHLHILRGSQGYQLQEHDVWFESLQDMVAHFAEDSNAKRFFGTNLFV